MTSDNDHHAHTSASLLDYLRLFRIPNVCTALADVSMGYACARASFQPVPPFLCLLGASALLYTAGMVLNDVYDVQVDARERPWRPVASGRIPVQRAKRLGVTLLIAGVALGALAGFLPNGPESPGWRAGVVALLLAMCVWLYDAWVKSTWAGPIAMGACRFLNVLFGASLGAVAVEGWRLAGFEPYQVIAAGSIGIYVVGLTWFARREAGQSRAWQLSLATLVIVAGISMLALLDRYLPPKLDPLPPKLDPTIWYIFLALLGFPILRRCLVAITDPSPERVQLAVKHGIMSIIVLDAAVTLEVSSWYHAVGVLALLIPTVVLGRWVYST